MSGNDRVKEQILEQADIGEIVSQYVRLQNRGGRMFGLCPFHKEKTPSFSVNPERGIFHCFGCGKGGNAIDFIMGVENLTFSEARSHLATKLGIPLDPPSKQPRSHAEIDRYQVMDQAAQFYSKCLIANPTAMQYLHSREIKPEQIKQYGLGYAPDQWDSLLGTMRQRKFPDSILEELGLIIPRKEANGYYDRFRNRIMFPIRNTLGRTIAFGGRSLNPNDRAKYLNSNDTPLFNKSKVLYLLDRAKEVLKERGAVLVEGYMDAISLHARGFQQAVASLGTALTGEHIHILHRYTNHFTLLYDGDSAGIRAAMRGVEMFFEAGHTVRVALLPNGMDPDDFIKKNGIQAMQEALDRAGNGFEFYVQQIAQRHDPKTTQGKLEIVEATLPVFTRIGDPLILKDCIIQLARQLENQEVGVLESTILKKLKSGKYKTYSSMAETPSPIKSTQPRPDSFATLKEPLIRILAFSRGFLLPEGMTPRQARSFLNHEKIREISQYIPLIHENSNLDRILDRLLKMEESNEKRKQMDSHIVAQLSDLFPDSRDMTTYIAVSEAEPIPNSEKELQKMWDQIIEGLYLVKEKRIRQTILSQVQQDPKKALEAFNERIVAERPSAQTVPQE